jgi:electron transport complex protein RnfG
LAKEAKLKAALSEVLPEFEEVKSFKVKAIDLDDSLTFHQGYNNGEIVGTAVETFTNQGFSGYFKIIVGFENDGKIVNTAVLEHKETPGLGDKMDAKVSDKFPNSFIGKHPEKNNLKVKKDGGEIDAITASTITSRAFCEALDRGYKTLNDYKGGQNNE